MGLYFEIYAIIIILSVLIVIFRFELRRLKNIYNLKMNRVTLTDHELEMHVKELAKEHSDFLTNNISNWPIPRLNDNYEYILSVYRELSSETEEFEKYSPVSEWLLDNFYFIEEKVREVKLNTSKKNFSKLPDLRLGEFKNYPRILALIMELVTHTDGKINEDNLIEFITAYQSHNILYEREIWAIPMVMKIALVENIRRVTENIKETQKQRHKAEKIIISWLNKEDTVEIMNSLRRNIKESGENSFLFIEHLLYHLRRSGENYTNFLKVIEETLDEQGSSVEDIVRKEHDFQSSNAVSMGNYITSLKNFSTAEWSFVFESISSIEKILEEDPAKCYSQMDIPTKNFYREKVEELASIYGVSEIMIAKEAMEQADKAYSESVKPVGACIEGQRSGHVGYYLVGNGRKLLDKKLGGIKKIIPKIDKIFKKYSGLLYFYTAGIIFIALITAAVLYAFFNSSRNSALFLAAIAGMVVLVPASEIALSTADTIFRKGLVPSFFPRLELKDGVPEEMSTIIVIPAIIPDEKRVQELLGNLERCYLANREKNLYFALLGSFKDSASENEDGDSRIITKAINGIRELNKKYDEADKKIFYSFHRKRQFSEENNKWIGWERKRGTLLEFNDLLLGSRETSFYYSSTSFPNFNYIKYVITLDSDTILPIGTAKKMIGIMAHPLNRPSIDKEKNIVIEGYGILQPKVDLDIESVNATLFSRVFTGQKYANPYAVAEFDIYQDLFGEGIFTGKGIYDLRVFQTLLKNAFPENAVLSHDLLEGSYLKTALVSDFRLIDSFPATYISYCKRLHRWTRGDWQLLPFIFGKYPFSAMSRWKMLDNIRRSLVAPSLVVLFIMAMTILPGSNILWTGLYVITLAIYLISHASGNAVRYVKSKNVLHHIRIKKYMPSMGGIKATFYQTVLNLVFLTHQAFLMAHAVLITLLRVFITKKNLLEWVPSADVEKGKDNSLKTYMFEMQSSIWLGLAAVLFALYFKRYGLVVISILYFVIASAAPYVAYRISQKEEVKSYEPSKEEIIEIRRIARKTWRYFEEFINTENNYLGPDNYQEYPPNGLTQRTSPTNISLGLMSVLAARDFGYLGILEMKEKISNTISSIEKIEKWNGHLYNWYDAKTLKPLIPRYISTADSGNFVGYLITLSEGLKGYLEQPIIDIQFLNGMRDALYNGGEEGVRIFESIGFEKIQSLDILSWNKILKELTEKDAFGRLINEQWKNKFKNTLKMFDYELTQFTPEIDLLVDCPSNFKNEFEEIIGLLKSNASLAELPGLYKDAVEIIGKINADISGTETAWKEEAVFLSEVKNSFIKAIDTLNLFLKEYNELISRIDLLSDATKFRPLYDEKKQLFSVGFDLEENRLTNSYYDLLASEARQASYISIARYEIGPEHWFKLSRAITVDEGYRGLLSWSGTMFEYLMPVLIMKSYKNTLLDETYDFVIRSQKKYGRQKKMPWGTSESGFNSTDLNLNYQYKACGVPWLGLKRGLIEDAVASPYSTLLALQVDTESAIENIGRLKAEGLEGDYGFYEAADYTTHRLAADSGKGIVREFMSHHQGMSFMAMDNFLNGFIMQTRFFANPAMYGARLLLQEQVPSMDLVYIKEAEKVKTDKNRIRKETGCKRSFNSPDTILPKVHLLSNGTYSVMITDRGTGYSRYNDIAITRWREDNTLDRYGMFFYIKNTATGEAWSAAYAPLNYVPEKYEVVYTNNKAVFTRIDGAIRTQTEVIVDPEENAEIRRITLGNYGENLSDIEITSYLENVMATQNEDISHPAFQKLFIKTEFLKDKNCIIANRRPKSLNDKKLWTANFVLVTGEIAGAVQFETDRMKFVGRNKDLAAPYSVSEDNPLSGTEGSVLDPVMSLRLKMRLQPEKSSSVSFITAVSESREELDSIIEKYLKDGYIDRAFSLAETSGHVETAYLNAEPCQMELYQNMTSNILFNSNMKKKYQELILKNDEGQSSLWPYGISGDNPIVLTVLREMEEIDVINEIIKAHEYWRLKNLKVDLIILCEEDNSYNLPLHSLVLDILDSSHIHNMIGVAGGAYIVDKGKTKPEDIYLLYAVARLIVTGEKGTLAEQMAGETAAVSVTQKEKIYSRAIKEYENPASEETELLYPNGLGGFDRDGRSYFIRIEKDQTTPAPWLNVISNPKFGFTVSETGSGYTWAGNSRENKLSPWSNDPVCDEPGEMLYINDDDTGELWTVTPLPVMENEDYEIRHGFGYTEFRHVSHGIDQKLIQFVPLDETVKISSLKLFNSTKDVRNLALTYYVRPVMGVTDQVTAMHIRTSLSEDGALLMENPYNEEYKGEICFIDSSQEKRSVTGDRMEFFGSGNIGKPESLGKEKLSGKSGIGFDPCAAIQVNISLNPMEGKDIVFTFGAAGKIGEVDQVAHKYRDIQQAERSLTAVKEFWKERLETVQVDTPDNSMDILLNGWLQYQNISCRLWARTAFYQSSGAFGFRDQLQDALNAVHIWPEITREQILLHARHQFLEGDVQHWWHEPNGKGVRTRCSDDLLWLPYVTSEYVRITGDKEILKTQLSFLEATVLADDELERYSIPAVSGRSATLFEHCVSAIDKSLTEGIHGLPLMGSGDWNDGMNGVGIKGSGESVWLGWFLITVLMKFAPLCIEMEEPRRAEEYGIEIDRITKAVEETAWDGKWYRRAYFDDGTPLGSIQNAECKIDSITQSWAVLSGAGEKGRARQAMSSVEDYLVVRTDGLIKLLTPPFDKSEMEPGYIQGYVPGVRENGGQYTHAAAWVIIAFAKLGDGDKACELFELINPINNANDPREYLRYKGEPYVMSSDVYSVYPNSGRSGWTWYTGSAGWIYTAGLEHILGFQKNGDTLVMDPCIPKKWTGYTIRYKYIETTYNINVRNPDGINKGVKSISTGGKVIEGNSLKLVDDGKIHDIEVTMG